MACPACPPVLDLFASPLAVRPKEASDSNFTIEDVMLWLGMRFSLRSQCKRCSAGRLRIHTKNKTELQNPRIHSILFWTGEMLLKFKIGNFYRVGGVSQLSI